MPSAFSSKEKEIITAKLRQAAREYASRQGMKKTSVDQLALAAGISKGMFYKLYPVKEILFFEMMEELHNEIYGAAAEVFAKRTDLSNSERLTEAFMASVRTMDYMNMTEFFENEVSAILMKVPEEMVQKHFHDDTRNIAALIQGAQIPVIASMELITAAARAVILTISHKKQIGPHYQQVIELMIKGICREITTD